MMKPEMSIQQAAERSGISIHTLRYYEQIGLILNVNRAANGYRRYNEDDLEWINFLIQLKATGMSLEDMQKFAELRREGIGTSKQRREMLEAHRDIILRQIKILNDSLHKIDYKIERHRQNEQSVEKKPNN